MWNKIVSIFLFFIIVVPTIILFLWFKMEKRNAQIIFEETIHEKGFSENLSVLKFSFHESHKELTWENNSEFQYKNEMYDLIFYAIENDSIYIICWLDKKETTVNKKYNEIIKHFDLKNSDQTAKQKNLNSYLNNLYCSDKFYFSLKIINHFNQHFFSPYSIFYTNNFYTIFDPPPKV